MCEGFTHIVESPSGEATIAVCQECTLWVIELNDEQWHGSTDDEELYDAMERLARKHEGTEGCLEMLRLLTSIRT